MRFVICFLLCIILLISTTAFGGVKDTKHNLSVSGPGEIKAIFETEICIFCHTPHNASPQVPLWNHDLSAVENYINYWSPTLQAYSSEAEAPPIDGFSKLCLSCHDGTIGLGAIRSREDIEMVTIAGKVESGRLMPGASGYLGTDLSGGHPISFIFDEALVAKRNSQPGLSKLNWPIIDPDVKLYPTQGGYGVQCSSCHDPHGTKADPLLGPPLWRKATYDEVCLVCHESIEPIGH